MIILIQLVTIVDTGTAYAELTWTRYFHKQANTEFPYIMASGVAVDAQDNVWISSTNTGTLDAFPPYLPSGVFMFDGETWTQYTEKDGLASNDIYTMTSSPSGAIWCGSQYGFSMFDGETWNSWINNYNVYNIKAIAFDNSGNGWIGHANGLIKYNVSDGTFTDLGDMNGSLRHVDAIAIDKRSNVWIGSANGLYKIEGDEAVQLLDNYHVTSIAIDSDGKIWAGIYCGGVKIFNGDIWTSLTLNDGYYSYDIRVLKIDTNDKKWIGTRGGFYIIDNDSKIFYDFNNSPMTTSQTIGIAFDSLNRKWVLTSYELYLIEDGVTAVNESRPHISFPKINSSFPNPFNLSTTIEFTLPFKSVANLSIYNITGQKVRILVSEPMTAGLHSISWDGKSDSGQALSSDVYIARISMGDKVFARSMVLVK
ncbi:MAG: T9SS type A sorting domain-containing protein [Candidatus Latescibacteria bacterium]|nr:T9SS type A sorting domain-containing protein [Candidatus Latescibacterota bacterium]